MNRDEYEDYYTWPEWELKREAVRRRCQGICERCGQRPFWCPHHVTYKNLGHEKPEDLLGICWDCNEFLHERRKTDPINEPIKGAVPEPGDHRSLDRRLTVYKAMEDVVLIQLHCLRVERLLRLLRELPSYYPDNLHEEVLLRIRRMFRRDDAPEFFELLAAVEDTERNRDHFFELGADLIRRYRASR
jgi:hypothetical protein